MDNIKKFTDLMAAFIKNIAIILPDDVRGALDDLKAIEDGGMARTIYDTMYDNIDLAIELKRPLCQDTGYLQFFIEAGSNFPYLGQLKGILRDSLAKASLNTPLRPNVVDPFTHKNTNTNIGYRAPWFDFNIIDESDQATIHVYMAGGGASMPGQAKVLTPIEGLDGLFKFVLDIVSEKGIFACPPLIIGVGIGSFIDQASVLSKRALLREVGSSNPNELVRDYEEKLFNSLNNIAIGPQGLGGKRSLMALHIEEAFHHPASLAVAVSVGCWASRKGKIVIGNDLSYKILSHKGMIL